MSVPVLVGDLKARVDEFGPTAFLVTTNEDLTAHVVSAVVELDDDALLVPAGRTTRANARRAPAVTLLWPAGPDGAYSLIVDATALSGTDDQPIRVIPNAAILHRMAGRGDEGPICLPITDPVG